LTLGFVMVFGHVLPHELPEHLRGWPVLATAGFEELVAQSLLNPYAHSRVFDTHAQKCSSNGYT